MKISPPQNKDIQMKHSAISHIPAENTDRVDPLEPPRHGDSNEYPQPMPPSRNIAM